MKARLILETGDIYEGDSIGLNMKDRTSFGELVFNTSMVGYQEILTDPSYADQIIMFTYPEIGNYGINRFDSESENIYASGVIVKNCCKNFSHYLASNSFEEYLREKGIMGICGVDTRSLTRKVRIKGAMYCAITTDENIDRVKEGLKSYVWDNNIVKRVSVKEKRILNEDGKLNIALIDCGCKRSIVDILISKDCRVTIYPSDVGSEEILSSSFDAVLISNGPGDPKDAKQTILTVKDLVGRLPLFGICLGFQILSIVLGAKTYKLKFGHRGGNHPCMDVESGKVIITSQNHGYAVDESTLGSNVKASFINLNDNTLEGIKCEELGIEAVQFHPESAPGPYDAVSIFDKWINKIKFKEISVYAKR